MDEVHGMTIIDNDCYCNKCNLQLVLHIQHHTNPIDQTTHFICHNHGVLYTWHFNAWLASAIETKKSHKKLQVEILQLETQLIYLNKLQLANQIKAKKHFIIRLSKQLTSKQQQIVLIKQQLLITTNPKHLKQYKKNLPKSIQQHKTLKKEIKKAFKELQQQLQQ